MSLRCGGPACEGRKVAAIANIPFEVSPDFPSGAIFGDLEWKRRVDDSPLTPPGPQER
jgi:hypothetical protein